MTVIVTDMGATMTLSECITVIVTDMGATMTLVNV